MGYGIAEECELENLAQGLEILPTSSEPRELKQNQISIFAPQLNLTMLPFFGFLDSLVSKLLLRQLQYPEADFSQT